MDIGKSAAGRMFAKRARLFVFLGFFLTFGVVEAYAAVSGQTLWAKRYNSVGDKDDMVVGVAVGSSSNVYVTGESAGDYLTIKYSPSGAVKWQRSYNGPVNGDDGARSIRLDGRGNVYVAGDSDGQGDDYALVKYDSVGNEKWARRFAGGAGGDDQVAAMAVKGGHVYVTGTSLGLTTKRDLATVKYDLAGNRKWVRRHNSRGNGQDYARALVVDAANNVYVVGLTGNDYTLVKYDAAGTKKWVKRYNGSGRGADTPAAAAVDAAGNIYITGQSLGQGTKDDFATVKYSPAGNVLWVRRWAGPGESMDGAAALAIDGAGNVIVTGTTMAQNAGEQTADPFDLVVIKYDADGREVWAKTINDYSVGFAVFPDTSGNILIGGFKMDLLSMGFGPLKLDSAGNQIFTGLYSAAAGAFAVPTSLAVGPGGNAYIAGLVANPSRPDSDYLTVKFAP